MQDGPARLREWSADDGDWYLAQLGDPDIRRFTTEDPAASVTDFRAALAELAGRPDQAGFAVVDAATGALAGNIAAQRHPDGIAEVHYWIVPDFRDRGLAGHALTLLCEWIGRHWEVDELVACIHAQNVASQRAAGHAGFRHQPGRDELRSVDGEDRPVRCYARPV